MSRKHSVQAHLGTTASEYDRVIRTFIPGYEQMLSTIGWWLSQIVPQYGRVTELGGGTGALAEMVLRKLPEARIEVWDIDPKMLAVAQDRLQNFGDRVTLREKSFTEKLDECHAVISTLSLHHILRVDAKRAVYTNILEALAQDSIFLDNDCTMDMT